jgi:hypothetical protein
MASLAGFQAIASFMHQVHHECALCMQTLNEEHPPVPLEHCCHVFGKKWLEEWLDSNNAQRNKFPTCRALLFGEREVDQGIKPTRTQGRAVSTTNAIKFLKLL